MLTICIEQIHKSHQQSVFKSILRDDFSQSVIVMAWIVRIIKIVLVLLVPAAEESHRDKPETMMQKRLDGTDPNTLHLTRNGKYIFKYIYSIWPGGLCISWSFAGQKLLSCFDRLANINSSVLTICLQKCNYSVFKTGFMFVKLYLKKLSTVVRLKIFE